MARRKKKTEKEQAQQFALMLPVVLGLLATLAWWKDNPRAAVGLLIAGPAICLVALILPPIWLRIFRLWMKFGAVLNFVMTRVILTIFYFLILTRSRWPCVCSARSRSTWPGRTARAHTGSTRKPERPALSATASNTDGARR